MDRAIKKKKFPPGRIAIIVIPCLIAIFLAYLFMNRSGGTRFKVDDPSRITFSKAEFGEFQEYYPFDGTIVPVKSVYLDVEAGGRVDEIFVEGGKYIQKGDLILRFSNAELQRTSIDSENQLLKNLDELRNTQITIAQNKLNKKDQLLDLNYQILELEKTYDRYKVLIAENSVISEQEYENVRNELEYRKGKRDLLKERIRQEDILGEIQLEQANKSIERLNRSLDLLSKTVDSLEVPAPISGYLSTIDAEIGQTIARGQRIGQIDLLDKLKVSVRIDQYYISKVAIGTKGKFKLEGDTHEVEVKKIYPEVVDNVFVVDMAFLGDPPKSIKRGQTLTIELSFSAPEKSLMVKKGGFYQQTGGRWAYLISEDKKSARRQPIRLGRQNPKYVEILEGLNEGDWIITSGYDTFKEKDILIFKEPINLTP